MQIDQSAKDPAHIASMLGGGPPTPALSDPSALSAEILKTGKTLASLIRGMETHEKNARGVLVKLRVASRLQEHKDLSVWLQAFSEGN